MAKRRKRRDWRNISRAARHDQEELDKTLVEHERLSTRESRWRERLEEEGEEQPYDPNEYLDYPLGVVLNMRSGHHYVRIEETGEVIDAKIPGVLKHGIRNTTTVVAPGDRVHVEIHPDGGGLITAIAPRKNTLSRPDPFRSHLEDMIVTNVDQLVIVSSVGGPAFWPELVDRYLVFAEYYALSPLIVVNKIDLAKSNELALLRELYQNQLNYNYLETSTETGQGINELRNLMKNKSTVVTGLSGVGKSSILNAIQPGLQLEVRSVNIAYGGEGKHTTRTTTLHPLDFGGFVADTPGIRNFGIWDMTPEEVDFYFIDFRPFLGNCKFSDCTHHNEPDCAIRQAVEKGKIAESRYKSFLILFSETDPAAERPF